MNPITEGLTISALGLIITFSALGVFILIIIGLQKFFPYKSEKVEPEVASEELPTAAIASMDEDEVTAAAIAVAIAIAKKKTGSPSLGAALTDSHSGWWSVNRTPARQSRDLVKS